MPTNYRTIPGDSLQKIAAKFYGDRSKGYLLAGANPGLKYTSDVITTATTLLTGQEIIVPDQAEPSPSATPGPVKVVSLFDTTPQQVSAEDEDEITLNIRGQSFKNFNNIEIKFDYDKIANEFSFVAPFEPDVKEYREAFKPLYQPASIYIGGSLVISGQAFANPNLTSDSNTVTVRGYSITGNINKGCIVAPFQFDEGTTFAGMVTDIATRSGLAVVIDPRASEIANKPFEKRVVFSPSEPAGQKLATLARERNLILSSTFNGRILVTLPQTEAATVQAFVAGDLPTLSFEPTFNADALHTSYIGYAPETPEEGSEAADTKLDGFPQPGIIPRIKGVVPGNTENQNIEAALRAERGRAFAAWFSASLIVSGWRDRAGALYQPNTLVTVRAPRAMIYEDTTFFVRAVTLSRPENKKQSKLDLILPEALTGRDLKITV
jgi:prophage tail gpP-like protein/phage tail protein X